MSHSIATSLITLSMMLGTPAVAQSGSAKTERQTGDREVAEKALRIVADIHGSWTQMPGNIATRRMTAGALIGNGSVGVAIGGTADKQQYYVGRDDFWSIQRGKVMPVGRVEFSLPALAGGTAQLQQNIGPADVTGTFASGASQLKSHAWVDSDKNYFFVELENSGSVDLNVGATMLDGFGQQDRGTLGGVTGKVYWRKVSPEVVAGAIGGENDGKPSASTTSVRSLQIFADAQPRAGSKPIYTWQSQTSLNGNTGAAPSKTFTCGDLLMPERRFAVRASVKMDHAGEEGVIFSAVSQQWNMQEQDSTDPLGNVRGHDSGRPQGAQAGLRIYLSAGRLAANLNGTVVTANQSLSAQKWTDVSVVYDATTITLLVDGKSVGESTDFPTSAQVMGPEWKWAASHPGLQQVPFAGIAPEGVLAMRLIGANPVEDSGTLHFVVAAGRKVIVAVAATDDRDSPGYFQSSLSDLEHASEATVAATWKRHVDSWRNFWSKSYVEIPNKTVQAWWYGSLYVLASSSKSGNVAPGLWGNWITTPDSGWQGDYTLDYNYQAPFWAAFPTNHVDLADPYDAPLLAWMDRGRGLARQLHSEGLVYYTHLAPSPGWSSDNFRALDQKSDALFAAVNCVQRWRYTRDVSYARKMWPFLTGVAEFWDHDLKLVNGRYTDLDDAEDEHLWGSANDVNPATVIGFLNMLYPAMIDMSEQLNEGQNQRAAWKNILAHLSPLPIAPANGVKAITDAVKTPIPGDKKVILESEKGMQWVDIQKGDRFSANPPVSIEGSSAGMNSLQVIFPAWNVGLESAPELRQAAINTVDYTRLWYDSNNTSNVYPAAANAGYDASSILQHLDLMVTHLGYQNFAYKFDAGGIENEATVPTTIAAMMLQSYQKSIHVFANWPVDQDASFGNLLAVGNFLVSSSISKGKVDQVRVVSQHGGPCSLANPWGPEQAVTVKAAGAKSRILHGPVFNLQTRVGDELIFSPSKLKD